MISGVLLTKKAEKDFESILNYIELQFGQKAADTFRDNIFQFLTILPNYPNIGTVEIEEKNIRCFVAHHRLKILYRIKNNNILILRLFDTRQHPGKV